MFLTTDWLLIALSTLPARLVVGRGGGGTGVPAFGKTLTKDCKPLELALDEASIISTALTALTSMALFAPSAVAKLGVTGELVVDGMDSNSVWSS